MTQMPKQIYIPVIDLTKENLLKIAEQYPEQMIFFVQPKDGGIGIIHFTLKNAVENYFNSDILRVKFMGNEIDFETDYIFQKIACRIKNKHQHGKHANRYMLWEDKEIEKRFV